MKTKTAKPKTTDDIEARLNSMHSQIGELTKLISSSKPVAPTTIATNSATNPTEPGEHAWLLAKAAEALLSHLESYNNRLAAAGLAERSDEIVTQKALTAANICRGAFKNLAADASTRFSARAASMYVKSLDEARKYAEHHDARHLAEFVRVFDNENENDLQPVGIGEGEAAERFSVGDWVYDKNNDHSGVVRALALDYVIYEYISEHGETQTCSQWVGDCAGGRNQQEQEQEQTTS